jgi:hemolysin III
MASLSILFLQGGYDWVQDSGPIYEETIEGRFPVEPWNTFSNLVFLYLVIWLSYKVYKSSKKHLYLKACLPIILIGYIGGTVYHATRSAEIWLLMDWVPIMLLCLSTSIYFVFRLRSSLVVKIGLIGLILLIVFGIRALPLLPGLRTSLGYTATALSVLLPLFIFGYQTRWNYFTNVTIAIICFALAVIFRSIDKLPIVDFLYMGTHWLWHLLGGVASFFVLRYVFYSIEDENIHPQRGNMSS